MRITRRGAIAGAAAGLAAAKAAVASGNPPSNADLPNILWLVSEDNNPYLGAYGSQLAHTPNIDRLAREGVLFRRAYSNAPVCAPSRFAILTGVHPESCSPAHHMRAIAHLPESFRTYPELMRQAGYFCINNPKTDYNCDVDPEEIWDIQGLEGHWRATPAGKPFLCVLNTGTTHEQQICRDTPGRVTSEQVRLPAFLPDTPVIRKDYADYHNLMEAMDREIGVWLAQLDADGLADDTIVFYYADNGGVLPRSKRYCYEEGLRVPLIVRVPPKWRHLAPFAPGTIVEAPVTLIDLPPTLLSIAGIRQPPQMVGRPLLGRRVGAPQNLAFGMRNRMDERYDFVRTVTDGRWRYIRNYMPHRPWGQHVGFEWEMQASYREWHAMHLAGQLTPVQDRFFQPKPFEELYDLETDPDEVNNLIDRADAAGTAARLREALDRHMVAINDNGFLPEGVSGQGFFESRNRTIYPLRRLMRIAGAAARREPRQVPRFRALLRSRVPAVRYWAAQGLLMLDSSALPARAELRAALVSDPVAQVRVVAAEALVAFGDVDEPVAVLAELTDERHALEIRLQALNALTQIGQAALPALPAIRKAASSPDGPDVLARLCRYLEGTLTAAYDPRREGISVEACQEATQSGRRFMGPPPSAEWPL